MKNRAELFDNWRTSKNASQNIDDSDRELFETLSELQSLSITPDQTFENQVLEKVNNVFFRKERRFKMLRKIIKFLLIAVSVALSSLILLFLLSLILTFPYGSGDWLNISTSPDESVGFH